MSFFAEAPARAAALRAAAREVSAQTARSTPADRAAAANARPSGPQPTSASFMQACSPLAAHYREGVGRNGSVCRGGRGDGYTSGMIRHRIPWTIAAVAVGLAVAVFLLRQTGGGVFGGPSREDRAERDRLVAEMLAALDMDPRVRESATQDLVGRVSSYCDTPALATAETWYAQGLRQYYGASNSAAAEEAFVRSSRMRPQWARPVNGLAILQFVAGRRDEAMHSFDRALALEPGWSRPHSDMAILLRRTGEMSAALDHAQQALAIEPEHPVNHFNYGVILDELGRHDEARAEYLIVLDTAPDMPQANYNMACSHAREGDVGAAVDYLSRAVEKEPLFRLDAREDPDFDSIRDTAAFRALVDGGAA